MPKTLVFTSKKTGAKRRFQGCPWATELVAVPGWKAEKTIIKNPEAFGGKQNSYIVYECPYFEPDTREETAIEEIIGALGLPVRYVLSNRLILWDYYDIYKILSADAKKIYGSKPTSEEVLKIKIAAVKGYIEDLEYDLNDKYITQEEFAQRLNLVDTLEKMLRKYHGKQQAASKE
jgi:hypothetical protein